MPTLVGLLYTKVKGIPGFATILDTDDKAALPSCCRLRWKNGYDKLLVAVTFALPNA